MAGSENEDYFLKYQIMTLDFLKFSKAIITQNLSVSYLLVICLNDIGQRTHLIPASLPRI